MNQNELMHFGVLGMKWGVRRYQNKDGTLTEAGKKKYKSVTKVGEDLSLLEKRERGIARALGNVNKHVKDNQARSKDYDIVLDDKKIGDVELWFESRKETNVRWIGIDETHRGKKYAQTIMDWIINTEKINGKEVITLEVPGISPDARHIYEKMGFIAGKEVSKDDVWGGLTEMKKRL